MKSTLLLISFLAGVSLITAVTPEYQEKVKASFKECITEHNMDLKEVIQLMKANKKPETPEQKCLAGCLFEKMDYIKDLTIDWEAMKAASPDKYESPELVEKANQVIDTCASADNEKGTDICEVAGTAVNCLIDEAQKVQLPKPDIDLES